MANFVQFHHPFEYAAVLGAPVGNERFYLEQAGQGKVRKVPDDKVVQMVTLVLPFLL